MVTISELYGKKIISTNGHWVGEIHHVVLDLENRSVSHLLLGRIESGKSSDMVKMIIKNSVPYDKVKKISETVLISGK